MTISGKVISLIFLSVGVFMLMQVSLPVVAFKLWEIGHLSGRTLLVSPQPSSQQVLGISISNTQNFPAFVSNIQRDSKPPYSQFSLSIPKLRIKDALVDVDSNDLSQRLAQLPGTALPGEKGNLFISGHSALPLFFKGDRDYGSIFANLSKLEEGDEIIISALGQQYVYKVVGLKVVSPDDTSVVQPPNSQGRYLSLMTCVPPGLNTKRLVVIGKLI